MAFLWLAGVGLLWCSGIHDIGYFHGKHLQHIPSAYQNDVSPLISNNRVVYNKTFKPKGKRSYIEKGYYFCIPLQCLSLARRVDISIISADLLCT